MRQSNMTLAVALFVPFRKCHHTNLSVPHYDSFYQQLSVPLPYHTSNARHNDSHNLLCLFSRLLFVVTHSFLYAMFILVYILIKKQYFPHFSSAVPSVSLSSICFFSSDTFLNDRTVDSLCSIVSEALADQYTAFLG